jgi:hypothetical protein
MASLRIGCGAGWFADRMSPSRKIAETGDLDYLCLETMAEATMSSAQLRKRRDPDYNGYDFNFDERMQNILPGCIRRKTKIVTNQGWINPEGAAERMVELLREMGGKGRKIAAISGNIITDDILSLTDTIMEDGRPVSVLDGTIISAEAYLGADPIVEALRQGADIVITGRVADPSLFVAPMIHEFGWDPLDAKKVGQGSGIGHLLECGPQVTGGYFSDPGFKDVPNPWDLGLPLAEVETDGTAVITKPANCGGAVNLMTVKEQIFYEVHDPSNYITPDVIVDFTSADLEQVGSDRVRVAGIGGKTRTPTLKVSIAVKEGFVGEDMFFYAGPGAMERAKLARRMLEERLKEANLNVEALRIEFLGVNAVHGPLSPTDGPDPYEVIVRIAGRAKTKDEAAKIAREVDGMAVSGIAMTGKRFPHSDRTREVIGIWSSLVARDKIKPKITMYES